MMELNNALGGMLRVREMQNREQLTGLQSVLAAVGAAQRQQEMQQQAQLDPLRKQLLEAELGQRQAAAAQAQARQQFFSPQNMQQFMTQGSAPTVVPAGAGETGGMDSGATGRILEGPQTTPGQLPGLDFGRLLQAGVQAGVVDPEKLIARQEQLQERVAAREQRMEELRMRLADARATAQERMDLQRQLAQMQIEGRRELRSLVAAQGGGAGRVEPFKFSVGGENVQGWRDRSGNIYDAGRNPVNPTNVKPEITTADQSAEQKRVVEQETLQTTNSMLSKMEEVNAKSPALVSGVLSGPANALGWMYNQVLGNATGNYVQTPGDQAKQLRDMVISSMGGLSRLSNQDRQRIEDAWKIGTFGNPRGIQNAIDLTRQIVSSRYAGSSAPVGRVQPDQGASPQSSGEVDFNSMPRRR